MTTMACPYCEHRTGRCERSGITLLEVLLATLVMAIGMLGLASLLPVGRYQLSQAARLDGATTMGRAAFRNVQIKGIPRPENWLNVDGSPCLTTATSSTALGPRPTISYSLYAGMAPPLAPVVVDPLLVSYQITGDPVTGSVANPNGIAVFPYTSSTTYSPNAGPQIARVTLKTKIGNTSRVMSALAADRLCRSEDDGVYSIPSDPTAVVQGLFVNTNPPSGATALQDSVRLSEGQYSWLAIVTPNLNDTAGWLTMPGDGAMARHAKITVVVFHKRPLIDLSTTPPFPPSERLCWIDFMCDRSGLSSSDQIRNTDARLRVSGPKNVLEAQKWLDIKTGQWVCATASGLPTYSSDPQSMPKVVAMRWYRVVSAGAVEDVGSGSWARSIRIAGPEWPLDVPDASGFSYPGYSSEPATAYCTLADGVVGVYERNVVIDRTSGWAN